MILVVYSQLGGESNIEEQSDASLLQQLVSHHFSMMPWAFCGSLLNQSTKNNPTA